MKLLLTIVLIVGCSNADERTSATAGHGKPAASVSTPSISIPNAVTYDGMLLGGRPSVAQLQEISQAGYRTIIDLRTQNESGVGPDRVRVTTLAMKSVAIPVAGAGGLTKAAVTQLDQALHAADGPVVLHCGSGNRVGAMLALRAHWMQGKAPAEALAIGKRAGLTSLEAAVTRLLGLPSQ